MTWTAFLAAYSVALVGAIMTTAYVLDLLAQRKRGGAP